MDCRSNGANDGEVQINVAVVAIDGADVNNPQRTRTNYVGKEQM